MYKKRCSVSVIMREVQITNIMRYHLMLITMVIIALPPLRPQQLRRSLQTTRLGATLSTSVLTPVAVHSQRRVHAAHTGDTLRAASAYDLVALCSGATKEVLHIKPLLSRQTNEAGLLNGNRESDKLGDKETCSKQMTNPEKKT